MFVIIIWQQIYYSNKVVDKVEANNHLADEITTLKDDFEVDKINQVDAMNREIIQAKYDIEMMRSQTKKVYDTIKNPTDKITNPQNYYEIKDWIVVNKEENTEISDDNF